MNITVIAPWIDIVTGISAELGFKFASWAKSKGHSVKVLYGIEATRLPLYLSLLADSDCVYYAGHGGDDVLVGNEVFLGLVTPFNASWFKNRVLSTMACLSARVLGPSVIREGGYAYVGATDVLYAAFPEAYDYLSDWLDYMMLLPKGIVEDKPIGEALNDLKSRALSYASKYQSSKPDDSWDWYYQSTLHNATVYTMLGDPSLRLSEVVRMREERREMGFTEGLAYLFREDVLREQWEDARRALFGFGAIAGLAASIIAPPIIDGIAGLLGVPKPFAETAKELAKLGATVLPTP